MAFIRGRTYARFGSADPGRIFLVQIFSEVASCYNTFRLLQQRKK
jgi:hypothetical protein